MTKKEAQIIKEEVKLLEAYELNCLKKAQELEAKGKDKEAKEVKFFAKMYCGQSLELRTLAHKLGLKLD